MADTKFVKAYCSVTDRYFALDVKEIGGTYKVVNMTDLPKSDARLLTSEIEQSSFSTHTNLIACTRCGNRKVGGCSCSKSMNSCSSGMKYTFNCIYCSNCSVDYSGVDDDVLGMVGQTVKLSQNQEVVIRSSDNRPLKKIEVGVGWDPAAGCTNMDVDSSVAVYAPDSSTHELIFYGNKLHPSGCVTHHGDNLTGEDGYTGVQSGDDENITVELASVPSNRDRLVFVLNIYQAAARHQSLDKVKNLYIKIYDPDSRKTLIEYHVEQNMSGCNSIVIGVARRKGTGWAFKAIGHAYNTSDVYNLGETCIRYV